MFDLTVILFYSFRYEESQQELEEYQAQSTELESELEAELNQTQATCSDLKHQILKLSNENDDIKVSLHIIYSYHFDWCQSLYTLFT